MEIPTGEPQPCHAMAASAAWRAIGSYAQLYAPLEKSMQALLAGYSKEELKILIDFAERSGGLFVARVDELKDSK